MTGRLSAELWIGGKIPENVVPDLCSAIVQQGICLEWGVEFFHPDSGDDLLSAVRTNRDGVDVLCLCYEFARWGEFEILEPFLQRCGIPFTRLTAGDCEYDFERVEFRPDSGRVQYTANAAGEAMVSAAKIREAESAMTRALTCAGPRSFKRLHTALENARSKLRQALPPFVCPLPAFEIDVGVGVDTGIEANVVCCS